MPPNYQLQFWAKLGKHEYPHYYHPLLFHLIDVAVVARRIWDWALRPPARHRFVAALGVDMDACRSWVGFIAGAHDIGKCSPGFQMQGNSKRLVDWLKQGNFDFNQTAATPHATASVPLLLEFLANELRVSPKLARRLAVAIGGHHGTFPSSACWGDLKNTPQLGQTRWPQCQRDLLNALANLLHVPRDRPPTGGDGDDQSYLMVLAGLTAVADWIGSNKKFFWPQPPSNWQDGGPAAEQSVQTYFNWAEKQAAFALEELGWSGRSQTAQPRKTFGQLFDYLQLSGIRPLQEQAEALAATLDGPALVLIEAPMGEGKTEAALCLADAWDRQGGQGLYVALPTMATSNGMFGRVENFIDANHPGRKQLHLLHGKSFLSEAYERLLANAKSATVDAEIYDLDGEPRAVVADEWFAKDKKQGLLAPFAVGTIDQALLAVLQTKHVFVRLFGLAGKVVILDEVHAYDAYMTTLMERLLEWLAALGSPVILLSATLPQKKRVDLLRAYGGPNLAIEQEVDYPRFSVVRASDHRVRVEHVPASVSKTIHLEWRDGELPLLADDLAKALQNGGCAAVIRNTVGLAQQTYRRLKAKLPGDIELELFHARFLFADRQRIENRVLERYGKGHAQRPRKAVLVASQVIEQSLDLDFDLMVSDVAPVDLILQRAGRLWRHQRTRPVGLIQPTLWLLLPKMAADGVPDFESSEWVYDRFILLRSFLALRGISPVTIPDDVEELIKAVYTNKTHSACADDNWTAALAEAEKEMKTDEKAYKNWARGFRIAKPSGGDEILFEFSRQLEEDNPEVPKCRFAATRLAEPTVSLVFLYKVNGAVFFDAAGKRPANIERVPTIDIAKELLAREGSMARDFHTAQQVLRADGSGLADTVISSRYYLADADFLVGLQGDRRLLEQLDAALRQPVWPLYLGRKSFVPGLPVAWHKPKDAIVDADLKDVLERTPCYRRLRPREKDRDLPRYVSDIPLSPGEVREPRQDAPVSFQPRTFAVRFVYVGFCQNLPLLRDYEDLAHVS